MNKGRNAWTPHDFYRNLAKARHVVQCSWGVAVTRSKRTGRWTTMIVFNDDDNEDFSFAFEIEAEAEALHLVNDILTSRQQIKKLASVK